MNVLLASAHPDDFVFSGGLIDRLRKPDNVIWNIYFCPGLGDPRNRESPGEHRKAIEVLGIDRSIEHQFQWRILEKHAQEVRNILWEIKEEYKPSLVICPSIHDFHQDHQTVADCCLTIFRDISTILGSEVISSASGEFAPNLFVELTPENVEKKMEAVNCYKSQLIHRSHYYNVDLFMAKLRARGIRIRAEYAEAYEFLWGRI